MAKKLWIADLRPLVIGHLRFPVKTEVAAETAAEAAEIENRRNLPRIRKGLERELKASDFRPGCEHCGADITQGAQHRSKIPGKSKPCPLYEPRARK